MRSLDVNLRGEVTTCIDFVVHIEGRVLRIAEVFFSVSLVHTLCDSFFIAEACPHLLTLFSVNDSSTCVLTEGELTLCSHFRIAEEGEGYILVVVRSFGVRENLCHLLVVRTTKEERYIAESLIDHLRDTFSFHLKNGVAFKFANANVVLSKEVILRSVLSKLEHRSVLEFRNVCHKKYVIC